MTPAQHATAATDLLAIAAPSGSSYTLEHNARLAEVHAILAGKVGTGTSYTSAEAELVTAAAATGTHANIARAKVLALLAT